MKNTFEKEENIKKIITSIRQNKIIKRHTFRKSINTSKKAQTRDENVNKSNNEQQQEMKAYARKKNTCKQTSAKNERTCKK